MAAAFRSAASERMNVSIGIGGRGGLVPAVQAQALTLEDERGVGGDDVHPSRREPHPVLHLDHLERRRRA